VKVHIQSNAVYRDESGKFRVAKYAKGSAMVWLYGLDGILIAGRDNNPALYHLMNSCEIKIKPGK
jgi:hypothetical protein